MKAIVRDSYGAPDVLRLEHVERPAPGPDDVLLRVRACSINASDCAMIESGKVRAVIERTYPLWQVAAALSHVGEGRALGKVVVVVAAG